MSPNISQRSLDGPPSTRIRPEPNSKKNILEERNRADQTIHDIESKLNEYKDQLDADKVKTLQDDAARVST